VRLAAAAPDALGGEQFWWFVARATGIVAWAVIVVALVFGAALAMRTGRGWIRPRWTFAVHRTLGTLVVITVGVHLAALVADSYVTFDLLDLVVPFRADYRPWGVAAGVLALWVLVVVQLGGRLRARVSPRWWRRAHRSAYGMAVLVSVHAALVGTDTLRGVYLAASVALALTPMITLIVRLRGTVRRPAAGPRAARGAELVPAGPADPRLP
jgi:predicted ferric reductase